MTLVAPFPIASLPQTPYFLEKLLSPAVEPGFPPDSDFSDFLELALPLRESFGVPRRSLRLNRPSPEEPAADGGLDGYDGSSSPSSGRLLAESSEPRRLRKKFPPPLVLSLRLPLAALRAPALGCLEGGLLDGWEPTQEWCSSEGDEALAECESI
jgi:hypothetical protein